MPIGRLYKDTPESIMSVTPYLTPIPQLYSLPEAHMNSDLTGVGTP